MIQDAECIERQKRRKPLDQFIARLENQTINFHALVGPNGGQCQPTFFWPLRHDHARIARRLFAKWVELHNLDLLADGEALPQRWSSVTSLVFVHNLPKLQERIIERTSVVFSLSVSAS